MGVLENIQECDVPQGALAVFWLGQAGFLFKSDDGTTVAIDPYLTNCGEAMRGFKRLSPMLIDPAAFAPDYYITSHIHFDHFDFEGIPQVAANGKTHFIGPTSCMQELEKLKVKNRTQLNVGDSVELGNIKLQAVDADHGSMAPDAIGVMLDIGGHRIYFAGDTCYRESWFHDYAQMEPAIAILPINGAFGNMNAREAAAAAKILGAPYVVPCHFWTFSEHGGDVQAFRNLVAEIPGSQALMFQQGEGILLVREA